MEMAEDWGEERRAQPRSSVERIEPSRGCTKESVAAVPERGPAWAWRKSTWCDPNRYETYGIQGRFHMDPLT